MFLLSGQKGRDAMKPGSRIGGGASALGYRHPLLSRISLFLQCLADMADPATRRRVRWTPHVASTAATHSQRAESQRFRSAARDPDRRWGGTKVA